MEASPHIEIDFCDRESVVGLISDPAAERRSGALLLRKDSVVFPVYYTFKTDAPSERLTVMYNGAVDRGRSNDGIVFQRSTWSENINSDVLVFADPTLLLHENMSLGWGQLDGDRFAPKEFSEILSLLRELWKLASPDCTLHYGSSAGGFQALATAAYDRGSKALANNPQLDWFLYDMQGPVTRVKTQILGDPTGNEVLATSPWRVRIAELFINQQYAPETYLQINLCSYNDFYVQLPQFSKALVDQEFLDVNWRLSISLYRDEAAGHSPLAKRPAVEAINNVHMKID